MQGAPQSITQRNLAKREVILPIGMTSCIDPEIHIGAITSMGRLAQSDGAYNPSGELDASRLNVQSRLLTCSRVMTVTADRKSHHVRGLTYTAVK